MTAPGTVTISGTYYDQDGTLATGTVVFEPLDDQMKVSANAIDTEPVTATLSSGVLSQALVNATGFDGYRVIEKIDTAVTPQPSYTIPGTSSVNLNTF